MFISPNFEINTEADSSIVTPQLKDNGSDHTFVDEYMFVENLGAAGKTPIVISEKVDRDRILLGKVDDSKSMWLYPSGKISVEI